MNDAMGENAQITNNVEKNGYESRQEVPGDLKMCVDDAVSQTIHQKPSAPSLPPWKSATSFSSEPVC